MNRFVTAAAVFAAAFTFTQSARAQLSPGGNDGPAVQPKGPAPDFAPPAIPGAGNTGGIATAPKIAKQNQGDPTLQLFKAINTNDYNSAQDAISRGANLSAQNSLGETPLDLSIALNQNSITFLLLSSRNQDGDIAPPPIATPRASSSHAHPMAVTMENRAISSPSPHGASPQSPGDNPGTPNASAGFLGFGPKT